MGRSNDNWYGDDRRSETIDQDWREHKGKILADNLENKQMIQKVLDKQTEVLLVQAEMKIEIKNIVNKNSFWTSSLTSLIVTTVGGVIVWWLGLTK